MTQFVTREHEDEPVPGLPGRLPEGERIVWQGRPDNKLVARRLLKVRWIAGYFILLMTWAIAAGLSDGQPAGGILFSAGVLVLMGALLLAMLEAFAWGIAKTTLYTITNKRVVMRFGVALSMTLNLPYSRILSAAMKKQKDGSGSLALALSEDVRLSWLIQWPHVRSWRVARVQPAFICLPDVDHVARVLSAEFERETKHERLAKRDLPKSGRLGSQPIAVAAE